MNLLTNRGMTPRTHGVVDYVACAEMLLIPGLLGLSGPTRRASQGMALAYLGVAVLTDYPLGLRRTLPFEVHGRIEALTVPLLLLMPRLLGESTEAEKRYWRALSLVVTTAYVSTDWKANPDE